MQRKTKTKIYLISKMGQHISIIKTIKEMRRDMDGFKQIILK